MRPTARCHRHQRPVCSDPCLRCSQLAHSVLPDSLDAVEDLLGNSNFAVAFDGMVKKMPDLERMLSRIHGKTVKKKDFLEVINVRSETVHSLLKLRN